MMKCSQWVCRRRSGGVPDYASGIKWITIVAGFRATTAALFCRRSGLRMAKRAAITGRRRELQHQLSRVRRARAPLSRASFEELLVVPVEAGGEFAGRCLAGATTSSGPVGGGDLRLAFGRLLELAVGQHAGELAEAVPRG